MEKKEFRKELLEMVKNNLKVEIEDENKGVDFFDGTLGFDSVTLLEFILEIEDTFDVIIPDEDLLPENFSSLEKLTDYVYKLVKSE